MIAARNVDIIASGALKDVAASMRCHGTEVLR